MEWYILKARMNNSCERSFYFKSKPTSDELLSSLSYSKFAEGSLFHSVNKVETFICEVHRTTER